MQDKIKTFRDKLRRLPRSRMAALEAILLIERPSTGHCHGYLFYLLLLAWEQASKPVATA
jgi:hypothetical protein